MARRPRTKPERTTPSVTEDGILDLLHSSLDEELACKRERVEKALAARGLAAVVPLPHASPRRRGARARVNLRLSREGRLVVHRKGSHEEAPPPLEAMARPEIVVVATAIEALLTAQPSMARGVERVELRSDGERVVTVLYGSVPKPARAPLAELLAPALGVDGALCLHGRALVGQPRSTLDVGPLQLEVGPLTFFQVNLEVNRALVASVCRAVTQFEPTRVLDLFGGAGNLSLPVSKVAGCPVDLVESHPSAVKDARANVARLGLPVTVAQEDAYALQAGSHFFDVAVLDPPRRGAGPAMAAVCATRPKAVVLVSCQPLSLARDVQQAMSHGYELASIELHDLFPLTSHVESLAVLTRR